ncbi:MAG: hypothetical protein ACOZE7_00475 [Pseudomonadota bacterium]
MPDLGTAPELQGFCRIDYQLATPKLALLTRQTSVHKGQWFSDHAPLIVDYDLAI